MPGSRLIRRREIWVPTWRGWLIVAALLTIAIGSGALRVHAFLSPNDPIDGSVLIVEGWLPVDALSRAAEVFAVGEYELLLTTGGPIVPWVGQPEATTYAQLAADYLIALGVPRGRTFAVDAPASAQDRTYLSAVMVREWAGRAGVAASGYDVFSIGPHARRTRHLFQLALGSQVPVGIISAAPSGYGQEAWWRSSEGTRSVLTELTAWMWVKCCFWPPSQGSHREKWGNESPARVQQSRLQQPGLGSEQAWMSLPASLEHVLCP